MADILPQAFGAADLRRPRALTVSLDRPPRRATGIRHDEAMSEAFDAVDVIITKRDRAS